MQRCLFGFIGLCWLVGCSSASISGTVPAGGKVTYKGNPVEGAIVTFHPEGVGRIATATTASGGEFRLTTVDAAGALPVSTKLPSTSKNSLQQGLQAWKRLQLEMPRREVETPVASQICTGCIDSPCRRSALGRKEGHRDFGGRLKWVLSDTFGCYV